MQDNSSFLGRGGGGPGMPPKPAPPAQPPLSDPDRFGNFFTAGWDDAWPWRKRATGTPDYPLAARADKRAASPAAG